jgi:hypothetical protein
VRRDLPQASARDVEAVLEDTFAEPISSRSTVSRILKDTASAIGAGSTSTTLHPYDEPGEGVLVAWGVTLEGHKVLLGSRWTSPASVDTLELSTQPSP